MAEFQDDINYTQSSNLSCVSEEYRKRMLDKNADGYVENNEYKDGHKDTISDGDMSGRAPKDNDISNPIGTCFDIICRNKLTSCGGDAGNIPYSINNQYGSCNC